MERLASFARGASSAWAIIFGGMLSLLLGLPIGALIVLVALKIALDLRFHLREHRPPASTGPGSPG